MIRTLFHSLVSVLRVVGEKVIKCLGYDVSNWATLMRKDIALYFKPQSGITLKDCLIKGRKCNCFWLIGFEGVGLKSLYFVNLFFFVTLNAMFCKFVLNMQITVKVVGFILQITVCEFWMFYIVSQTLLFLLAKNVGIKNNTLFWYGEAKLLSGLFSFIFIKTLKFDNTLVTILPDVIYWSILVYHFDVMVRDLKWYINKTISLWKTHNGFVVAIHYYHFACNDIYCLQLKGKRFFWVEYMRSTPFVF